MNRLIAIAVLLLAGCVSAQECAAMCGMRGVKRGNGFSCECGDGPSVRP